MTLAEFLAWEDGQELRYEFDGVRVIALTGGTAAHSLIQANLAAALAPRLRGNPCRFYNNNLKFLTAEDRPFVTLRPPCEICCPVFHPATARRRT
jgi:Uma2 family endonuclease